jgi:restriction endonuclease Mrr
VLEQMGGSGKVAEVLERVGKAMKSTLKPVDYDPLASGPDNPRWRNAAQWARNSMIRDGLLKADSSRGVWEISDKGRQTLKDSGKQGTN